MNSKKIIENGLKEFDLINPGKIKEIEIQLVQPITGNRQSSISHALCLILDEKYEDEFRDDCYYLMPLNVNRKEKADNISYYNYKDVNQILTCAGEFLNEADRFVTGISSLRKCLNQKSDLSEIVYQLYQFFNNPIVIVDESFKAIAAYPKQKTGCLPFDLFLMKEYPQKYFEISSDNIGELTNFNLNTSMFSCFKPMNVPIISAPIMNHDRCIGGFSIFETNQKLTQTDVHILDYLMLLLSSTSVIQNMKKKDNLSDFILNLITNETISFSKLEDKLEQFDIQKEERYALISAQIPAKYRFTYEAYLQNLRAICKSNFYAINDGCIHFLIKENTLDINQLKKSLDDFGKRESVLISFNNFISPLEKSPELYQVNQELISMLSKKRRVGCYLTLDYFYELILFKLSLDKNDRTRLPYYEGLSRLVQYDRSHQSEYYETLKEYLFHFASMNETADVLNIHRNTLSYRLQKAEEISQLPLSSNQELFNIFLTIQICKTFELLDMSEAYEE